MDKEGGIVCFVSNGSWIDGNAHDGFRKCLEHEFTSIFVFNTRGNARTSGELRQKEAGNVFGSGSRTPIAITLLIRNPLDNSEKAKIYYHDIGDYLTREQELEKLRESKSVLNSKISWTTIDANEQGDWISQRSDLFETFIQLGDKNDTNSCFFTSFYSNL